MASTSIAQGARATNVLRLVRPAVPAASSDIAEVLQGLLAAARRGELSGLVFAVHRLNGTFEVDGVGSYLSDPVLARGALAVLDDNLADIMRARMGGA